MPLPSRVADLAAFDLLLSVAQLGSVGAAARAHRISQPSASARIRSLERRLGVALLQRSARGSQLTREGALVAEWARTAVDAAAALEAGITSLRAARDSLLPVAASLTVAEYLLPRWLAALHGTAPAVSVALTTENSDEVAAAVLAGAVQLGFIESPEVPRGLHSRPVARDTLTVIVAGRHPWARRRSGITPPELAAASLVSREEGSGTRRYLEHALALQAGLALAPPVLQLSSTTAIKAAVMEGVAPAVLSSLVVAGEIAAGALHPVPVIDLDLNRTLRLVYPKGRALTGPARDLAAIATRLAAAEPVGPVRP
ncbi:LysR family transcriptional regulator [Micromonospora sp. NBC_00898]|uniref:LysR family transcriptional regulator n=1 Tax=Micromonospora sp. NBC_00898 TaxID=2975981 RepID=UPI003865A695|nr:LysR family transcriptional regulator [Micromonospora sp. NBC_00898]